MKITTLLASAAIAIAVSAAAAQANATVLYDNGAVNTNISGYTIGYYDYSVADSFVLASASVVDGVTFGSWTNIGNLVTSVDWEVLDGALSAGGNVIASGVATPTHSGLLGGGYGAYDVRDESFSIAPLALGGGTYWLHLGNAVTQNSGPTYWDVNNGPSSAEQHDGYGNSTYSIPSNSFQILGTASGAPEPASWALMLTGFLGAGAALRARRRLAVATA